MRRWLSCGRSNAITLSISRTQRHGSQPHSTAIASGGAPIFIVNLYPKSIMVHELASAFVEVSTCSHVPASSADLEAILKRSRCAVVTSVRT
jgi:hypothetical protein